jgi:AcrR family transcriptional regulator
MKVEPTFNLDYRMVMGNKPIMAGTESLEADSPSYAAGFAAPSAASDGKAPRTPRGEKTLRKILDAALAEFGSRGFSDSSIVGITRRARVALGTFYTYFDSKDAVFAALVHDMSTRVREHVAPSLEGAANQLDAERKALAAYLDFVVGHKEVYRIIDEAEFVDPEGFRRHYVTTAERIAARLRAGRERGELSKSQSPIDDEVQAWAIMGMNVFLGLRFGVWGDGDPEAIAKSANRMLREGLAR